MGDIRDLNSWAKNRYSASRPLEEEEDELVGEQVYDESAGPYPDIENPEDDKIASEILDKSSEVEGTKRDIEKVEDIDEARKEVPTEIEENLSVKEDQDKEVAEVDSDESKFQRYLDLMNSKKETTEDDTLSREKELEVAQDRDRYLNALTEMGKAGAMIGRGIAGVKSDDYSMFDNKSTSAKDLKERFAARDIDKKAVEDAVYKDPNSELSDATRNAYEEMTGKTLPPNLSAYQLQRAGFSIGTAASAHLKKALAVDKAQKAAEKETGKAEERDLDKLYDLQKRAGGLMRGGKVLNSEYTSLNAANSLRKKLDAALKGDTKVLRSDAYDISGTWSKAITGGVPGQTMVELTMPKNLQGEFGNWENFLKSKPANSYYTPELIEHMIGQLDILEGAAKENVSNSLRRSIGMYGHLLKKYPKHFDYMKKGFDGVVEFGEDGLPKLEGKAAKDATAMKEDKQEGDAKTVTKKMYSPSRDKTKIIYSDGTEEIVDGKQ